MSTPALTPCNLPSLIIRTWTTQSPEHRWPIRLQACSLGELVQAVRAGLGNRQDADLAGLLHDRQFVWLKL